MVTDAPRRLALLTLLSSSPPNPNGSLLAGSPTPQPTTPDYPMAYFAVPPEAEACELCSYPAWGCIGRVRASAGAAPTAGARSRRPNGPPSANLRGREGVNGYNDRPILVFAWFSTAVLWGSYGFTLWLKNSAPPLLIHQSSVDEVLYTGFRVGLQAQY